MLILSAAENAAYKVVLKKYFFLKKGFIKWIIIFYLFCHGCKTGCLGDGDSCNTSNEFDNMNSVQMITDVMFKSCLINPVVTLCLT